MKRKLSRAACLLLVAFILPLSYVNAGVADGWFGYYANDNKVHENYDHTNITLIWGGLHNRSAAKAHLLAQVAQAQAYGVKAVIDVSSFLFTSTSGSNGEVLCPNSMHAGASADFADLVNSLVTNGYLVPGNPSASVVAAFYPKDEPELCGLSDVGSNPHPALANAIDVIRTNPNTYLISVEPQLRKLVSLRRCGSAQGLQSTMA